MKAIITAFDMTTPYGRGIDACWTGLLSNSSAISHLKRFNTAAFTADRAGLIKDLDTASSDSLVWQMLKPILDKTRPVVPEDTVVILATTVGEVDLLEKNILNGSDNTDASRLNHLLSKICRMLGTTAPGMVISSACTSSTAALAHAGLLIRSGAAESVLVVACDSVTEFVFAGFSTLMALDPETARPFDRNRRGLTPGEAAGTVLLMSSERAERENRPHLGELAGWGMSNDANHMTGPSRDGKGLATAIERAIRFAGISGSDINSVCAHGSGTVYNDEMEIKAFRLAFDDRNLPTYSIKGGVGHTMGAAGLIEMLIALKSLAEQKVPPTVGLETIDDDAEGWAGTEPVLLKDARMVLSTNSGFGGVNAALVLNL